MSIWESSDFSTLIPSSPPSHVQKKGITQERQDIIEFQNTADMLKVLIYPAERPHNLKIAMPEPWRTFIYNNLCSEGSSTMRSPLLKETNTIYNTLYPMRKPRAYDFLSTHLEVDMISKDSKANCLQGAVSWLNLLTLPTELNRNEPIENRIIEDRFRNFISWLSDNEQDTNCLSIKTNNNEPTNTTMLKAAQEVSFIVRKIPPRMRLFTVHIIGIKNPVVLLWFSDMNICSFNLSNIKTIAQCFEFASTMALFFQLSILINSNLNPFDKLMSKNAHVIIFEASKFLDCR
ncbi:hypothetical protein CANARDRAFT_21515 [[Candida] arabinofermentans NRRL YB-2248]|uniref:Uncharacterized protein n=1 Tax=[Candida] arabinofermentans NRRL YB-2248 TaxID=983967 RepID=A0A1E4T7D5_9ASCO|nr:hypothetical protein CANARDRAFT_21515 [[Candida] arabinofermentans NRRL YB-2248]